MIMSRRVATYMFVSDKIKTDARYCYIHYLLWLWVHICAIYWLQSGLLRDKSRQILFSKGQRIWATWWSTVQLLHCWGSLFVSSSGWGDSYPVWWTRTWFKRTPWGEGLSSTGFKDCLPLRVVAGGCLKLVDTNPDLTLLKCGNNRICNSLSQAVKACMV